MALKHSTVVAVPDDPAYPVGTDEWNDAHVVDVSGMLKGVAGDVVSATPGVDYLVSVLTDASLTGDGTTANPLSVVAGPGGVTIAEAEIDFGSTPVYSKSFVVTAASAIPTSKIVVTPSAKTATGRVNSDDTEWDGLLLSAVPGTGDFALYVVAVPGPVVGNRKIQFMVG